MSSIARKRFKVFYSTRAIPTKSAATNCLIRTISNIPWLHQCPTIHFLVPCPHLAISIILALSCLWSCELGRSIDLKQTGCVDVPSIVSNCSPWLIHPNLFSISTYNIAHIWLNPLFAWCIKTIDGICCPSFREAAKQTHVADVYRNGHSWWCIAWYGLFLVA